MHVKLENPGMLSKAIDVISDLVMEVRVKVNDEGLSITAMDPANVAMVHFLLPKNAFSDFESGNETLGVNLDSLKKILRRCGTRSTLIIDSQENMLNIQILDKIKRNFRLALIDIESEEKEMPNLEFSSLVELNSSDLIDSVEDCLVVADACSFIIKNGRFTIEAKGLNSASSEFSGDEAKIAAEDCKSRYSLEYLQKFIKASKMMEKTTLKFAADHPLNLSVRDNTMELSFLLAPRVETED